MQEIGRYKITGELGRGAMGVVYKALDPKIGRTVAIKTIRLPDLTEPGELERLRERLFREAQSAGMLSHPNIVTIYDILEKDEMAYIFMEFVNGRVFDKLLSAGTPPGCEMLLGVLRQTAAALDYAHRKGIVHRDIKPANIMIDDDGTAKITDFGVARIVSHQITHAGSVLGTPSYMSPEQIQGTPVDGKADEFALGVVAYESLTGELPFTGEYLPTLLYKIVREDPVPASRYNPALAHGVDRVLGKALAKVPQERYATCSDFVRELERELDKSRGWTPMTRGTSATMATVVVDSTSDAIVVPVSEPITRPAEAPPARVPGPSLPKSAPKPAVTPAAESPPVSPPPVAPPPAATKPAPEPVPVAEIGGTRPAARLEPPGHTIRNVLLGTAAIIVVGAGLLFLTRSGSPDNTAAVPVSPQPAPSASNPPVQSAEKPSPVVPAEQPKDESATQDSEETKQAPIPPATPKPPKPQSVSAILFSTAPGNAKVVVDSNEDLTCNSPCTLSLPRGRHTVLATLDGYRPASRVLEVTGDMTYTIDLDQQVGTLSVTSSPAGATIILNGRPRPEKTPAVLRLPIGSYRLQVKSGDVETDEETVEIHDGVISQRKFTVQ